MKKIYISEPFIPESNKFGSFVSRIKQNKLLTNRGPEYEKFLKKLKDYQGTKNICLTSSCTIGLDLVLNEFPHGCEIITTPYSYVATLNSIYWQRLKPVFVDINKEGFNIDSDLIEQNITNNTKAILATHVYGLPCNNSKITKIAKKYNLKVIYDAAHAFGVKENNNLISNYGDFNIVSFHATKVMHSIEGGMIITKKLNDSKKLLIKSQFGHIGNKYICVGINAKLNEVNSFVGIEVLNNIKKIINVRKNNFQYFHNEINSDKLELLQIPKNVDYNYSYYPVLTKNKTLRNRLKASLEEKNIFPRKYFSPSLNKLKLNKEYTPCPNAESKADRVLCIPIHQGVTKEAKQIIINSCKTL